MRGRPFVPLWLLLLGSWGCAETAQEPADRELPPLSPRPAVQTCLAGLPDPPPDRLSDTGCFASLAPLEPGPDLIPYEVISPLWTDGAAKERYFVLPPGETIGVTTSGAWQLPVGSVIVKVFGFDQVVETRFMVHRESGWSFYSYRWNEAGTEATLLSDGMVADIEVEGPDGPRTIAYQYPSPEGCTSCHSNGVTRVLGPRTVQLNLDVRYGDRVQNQLEALLEIGALDALPADLAELPSMPDPSDTSATIEDRARAYLHANCSHCHQPGGWTSPGIDMDLRYEKTLAEANVCGVPVAFDLIPGGDYRIAPGEPERSSIYRRITVEGVGVPTQMPPLGRSTNDTLGVDLIRQWIESIETCPEE